ncbi:MAG: hypothetical protein GSR79_00835 [Desulfurococcales archaeon]|nr:hypothetical protein [Desulfurococcales archaeon]
MTASLGLYEDRKNIVAAWSPDGSLLLVASILPENEKIAGFLSRRRNILRVILYDKKGRKLWEKNIPENCEECKIAAGWKNDSSSVTVASNDKVHVFGRNGSLLYEASIRKQLLYGETPIRVSGQRDTIVVETNIGSTITISREEIHTRRRPGIARIVYNLLSNWGSRINIIKYSISPNHRLIAFSIESYLQISKINRFKLWGRDLGGEIGSLEWHPSSTSILSTITGPEYSYAVLTSLSGRELWRTIPFKGVFLDASWNPEGEEAALLLYNEDKCTIVRYSYNGEMIDTAEIDYCPTITWTPIGDLSVVSEEGFSLIS